MKKKEYELEVFLMNIECVNSNKNSSTPKKAISFYFFLNIHICCSITLQHKFFMLEHPNIHHMSPDMPLPHQEVDNGLLASLPQNDIS